MSLRKMELCSGGWTNYATLTAIRYIEENRNQSCQHHNAFADEIKSGRGKLKNYCVKIIQDEDICNLANWGEILDYLLTS